MLLMSQAPTLQALSMRHDAIPCSHLGSLASLQSLTFFGVRGDKVLALLWTFTLLSPSQQTADSIACGFSSLSLRVKSQCHVSFVSCCRPQVVMHASYQLCQLTLSGLCNGALHIRQPAPMIVLPHCIVNSCSGVHL